PPIEGRPIAQLRTAMAFRSRRAATALIKSLSPSVELNNDDRATLHVLNGRNDYRRRLRGRVRGSSNSVCPPCGSVLHDMRQLVGEQLPPRGRPRREPAGAKDNVVSHGVGAGVDIAC